MSDHLYIYFDESAAIERGSIDIQTDYSFSYDAPTKGVGNHWTLNGKMAVGSFVTSSDLIMLDKD